MAHHDAYDDSRFSYFLLQARVAPPAPDSPGASSISLTVEDLSSGEKRVFASILEFSRFLSRQMAPASNERWAPPADA